MLKLPPKLSYQEKFKIRTYDIGQHKEITVAHLLKLMHETALQNVIQLKVSKWDLEEANISWVLRRMHLQVKRLPRLGESVDILTNPAGFHRLFTFRDYRVYDAEENVIVQAASKWLLMNTAERKLSPIPSFITDFEMPPLSDCLPRPEHKLPPWKKAEASQEFQVSWYDLDFNGHLNNVIYFNWMVEPIDDSILARQQIVELDILYRAEAHWKEKVIAEVQREGEHSFLHRLIRKSDNKELAIAKTTWSKTVS